MQSDIYFDIFLHESDIPDRQIACAMSDHVMIYPDGHTVIIGKLTESQITIFKMFAIRAEYVNGMRDSLFFSYDEIELSADTKRLCGFIGDRNILIDYDTALQIVRST